MGDVRYSVCTKDFSFEGPPGGLGGVQRGELENEGGFLLGFRVIDLEMDRQQLEGQGSTGRTLSHIHILRHIYDRLTNHFTRFSVLCGTEVMTNLAFSRLTSIISSII